EDRAGRAIRAVGVQVVEGQQDQRLAGRGILEADAAGIARAVGDVTAHAARFQGGIVESEQGLEGLRRQSPDHVRHRYAPREGSTRLARGGGQGYPIPAIRGFRRSYIRRRTAPSSS